MNGMDIRNVMGVKGEMKEGKRERKKETRRVYKVVLLYYSINAITRFLSGGW